MIEKYSAAFVHMFTRQDAEKIYKMRVIKVRDVVLNIKWGRPKNMHQGDYNPVTGEMKLMKPSLALKK
jgi:hypothetical protein